MYNILSDNHFQSTSFNELKLHHLYKEKLIEILNVLVPAIEQETSEIWLFGSSARCEIHSGSDIDLLVIPISEDKEKRRELSLKIEYTDLRDDTGIIPVDIFVRRRSYMENMEEYFPRCVQKDKVILWKR